MVIVNTIPTVDQIMGFLSRCLCPCHPPASWRLHVCFANLATLYMYLEDGQKAQE